MNDFRKRVLEPALIPIGAFVFIGVLVFGFSRLLLTTTKDGSVVLGILMAGSILFGSGAVAKGGTIKKIQRVALMAAGASLVAGGVAVGAVMHTRPVEGHVEVAAKVTAQSIAFNTTTIILPVQKKVGILFTNKDPVPHNIHIFRGPQAAGSIFAGEIFQGPASREYVVPPLAAGSYFFHCDVHAQMTGTVVVGKPGPGGPPTGPAPSTPPPSSTPSPTPTPTATGGAAAPEVAMNDGFKFDPAQITIKVGQTVVWKNVGSNPHTVTADDQKTFDSGADPSKYIGPGGTFEFTFTQPGTYAYYCRLHGTPGGAGMSGTVVVSS